VTTVIGVFIDARAQRHLDEMDIAAAGFAARWSTVAVVLLAVFATFFAPIHPVLSEIYASISPDAEAPPQMFVMGVVAALVVRGTAAILLRAAWMHTRR
jgi:protein-S-isoprenylcysteine O-methyltransferase Ste14